MVQTSLLASNVVESTKTVISFLQMKAKLHQSDMFVNKIILIILSYHINIAFKFEKYMYSGITVCTFTPGILITNMASGVSW